MCECNRTGYHSFFFWNPLDVSNLGSFQICKWKFFFLLVSVTSHNDSAKLSCTINGIRTSESDMKTCKAMSATKTFRSNDQNKNEAVKTNRTDKRERDIKLSVMSLIAMSMYCVLSKFNLKSFNNTKNQKCFVLNLLINTNWSCNFWR